MTANPAPPDTTPLGPLDISATLDRVGVAAPRSGTPAERAPPDCRGGERRMATGERPSMGLTERLADEVRDQIVQHQ
jgi:hypothetical protein